MADVDLEALKRSIEFAKTSTMISTTPGAPPVPSLVLLNVQVAEAILGALERIPELERDLEGTRSAYRAEEARLRGVHRQALAERDAEIERLALRAERVEAAARRAYEFLAQEGHPLHHHVLAALRAALAPAPGGEAS